MYFIYSDWLLSLQINVPQVNKDTREAYHSVIFIINK